jgi:phenylacetate-CoA ligase
MALQTYARDVEEKLEIEELTEWAMARVPFYRDHLSGANRSNLAGLPTFHKHMTAGYGQFPLSAGGPIGAHRVMATSGTTGDRLYVAFDRTDWDRVGTRLEKVGQWVGLTSDDVLLNTHCYGLWVGGPVLDLLAHRSGACVVPLGPVEPAGVLHMLAGGVGTVISATPSYLRRVIEAAEDTGFNLAETGLRLGFIGAEAAEPSLRRKLLSRLPAGFRWVELYGLTETCGPSVAFAPDAETSELALNTEDFWIEVLDLDADAPVAAGEVGELTLTSRATNPRTPLVRYRTRDLVRVTAGESRAPTRISQILGRADDARKIGGVLMYPTAVAEIVSDMLPPTAEWRGVVRRCGLDDELLLEAEATPALCDAVETAFQTRVGLNVTVIPAESGALLRSREKTRRIVVESSPTTLSARVDAASAPVRSGRRSKCG